MGIVVGKLEGRLQFGSPGDDVLRKVPAPAQKLFFLLVRVAEGPVDPLILDAETVEGLVRAEAGENLLKLRLEFLVGDGLDAELLSLVIHRSFTFKIRLLEMEMQASPNRRTSI